VQRTLKLQSALGLSRSEDWIRRVEFPIQGHARRPIRVAEMRVLERRREALIQPSRQRSDRQRLSLAANVLARVFQRPTWSPEAFLARLKARRQIRRRQST